MRSPGRERARACAAEQTSTPVGRGFRFAALALDRPPPPVRHATAPVETNVCWCVGGPQCQAPGHTVDGAAAAMIERESTAERARAREREVLANPPAPPPPSKVFAPHATRCRGWSSPSPGAYQVGWFLGFLFGRRAVSERGERGGPLSWDFRIVVEQARSHANTFSSFSVERSSQI